MDSVETTKVAPGATLPMPRVGILGTRTARLAAGAAVLVVVTAGVVASRVSSGPAPVPPRTVAVARGSVIQTVAVSGAVNPAAQIRLSFKSGGRLAEVLVKVGDQVAAGQAIARLDTQDLQIALRQAQASLMSAEAKYDQTVAGATPEDIAVARQSVDNAKRALDSTRQTVQNDLTVARQSFDKLKSAYVAGQNGFQLLTSGVGTDVDTFGNSIDGVRTSLAQAVTDMTTKSTADITTAKNAIGQADASLVNIQAVARNQLHSTLIEWTSARDNVVAAWLQFDGTVQRGTDPAGAQANYQAAQLAYTTASARFQSALDSAAGSIGGVSTTIGTAQNAMGSSTSKIDAQLDNVRADLSGSQAALSSLTQLVAGIKSKITQAATNLQTVTDAVGGTYIAAQQNVQSTQQKNASSVQSAQNSYDSAVTSLAKTSAAPKSYEIASAYASVLSQQAALDKAKNDLDNATLRASAAGTVASIASQPGETVGSSASGFAVIAITGSLVLHGTIGEADVAKLKLGQAATVIVDAVSATRRVTGRITSIDPVATIQQGVPVYGVEVTIEAPDPATRAGMSGTANVVVASKQNVLTVPNLAIRSQNGRRSVQVLRDGSVQDAAVTFGIANDTVTEVARGLQEGDLVVLPQLRSTPAGQQGGVRVGGPGQRPGGPPFR